MSRSAISTSFPHWKECGENAKKYQKPCQKQPLHLEARGLSSNTWMPGSTPLTMPNDSSIAVRTSTQWRNKVPIGYNGTPQIHHQNLIHPYQARPHSPPQTVSGYNQLFCHNSHVCTDRWAKQMFSNISTPLYRQRCANNKNSNNVERWRWQ